jgi:hypothetical protein
MTEAWPVAAPIPQAAGPGVPARPVGQRGGGRFREHFLTLRGEDTPGAGVQATTNLWALVTVAGEPAVFISPEVVQGLDPDRPAAAFLAELSHGYQAGLAAYPEGFFLQRLTRPVRGQVYVLDTDFARAALPHLRLARLGAEDCDLGTILPDGQTCDGCQCDRRHSS